MDFPAKTPFVVINLNYYCRLSVTMKVAVLVALLCIFALAIDQVHSKHNTFSTKPATNIYNRIVNETCIFFFCNLHTYMHRWNNTRSMLVNTAFDTFGVLVGGNIYGLEK